MATIIIIFIIIIVKAMCFENLLKMKIWLYSKAEMKSSKLTRLHNFHGRTQIACTVSIPECSISFARLKAWSFYTTGCLPTGRQNRGVQGWRSDESTLLPPLWPGFDSQIRRQMWVEFVGSLLCTERFSPGTPVSPLIKNHHLT